MFRDKFWISLLLTIPTLIWGHMLPSAFGYTPPHVPGAHWIPAVFGTAVFLYGGVVFLRGAIGELRARLPGMMTLISGIAGRRSGQAVSWESAGMFASTTAGGNGSAGGISAARRRRESLRRGKAAM